MSAPSNAALGFSSVADSSVPYVIAVGVVHVIVAKSFSTIVNVPVAYEKS